MTNAVLFSGNGTVVSSSVHCSFRYRARGCARAGESEEEGGNETVRAIRIAIRIAIGLAAIGFGAHSIMLMRERDLTPWSNWYGR